MVCTANDLEGWKDFPKGLRVLLLDEDTSSSSEIRSKLEAMDYIVTAFCNETEALSAFSSNPASFHVAIVEVSATDGNWGFHFLETTKDLPIIMTSNIDCLNTTMKCIALGAVEFLRKPLCEEKLKNIWQHVVHKAFNGGKAVSESVEPIKEAVAPLLRPKLENEPPKFKFIIETENVSRVVEHDHEQSTGSDKYPAPSTPQIKPGSRFLDDGDCQDQTNCLSEKESGEHDGESKSVETTCNNAEDTTQISEAQMPEKIVVKQEKDSVNVSKGPINLSQPNNDTGGTAENLSKASGLNHSYKSSRKKMKVDWTPELHKKFVRAVEQLGVDQAIPSRILELMKTEGLTRHNVASHLQKYRMHKRHILPKDDDRRLLHPRDTTQTSYYNPHHKPTMAFPPYHFNNAVPMPPAYPMWGKPASHPTSIPMWGPPSYPPWQTPENWHWNPSYPGMHADAWGCPVMPQPLQGGYSSYHQIAAGIYNTDIVDNSHSMSPDSSGLQPTASGINNMPHDSSQTHPAEEIIDKVVKEAMKKPWLPLPLGLKLPYPEGVLAELSRQGICNIPPQNTGTSLR